MGKATLVYDDDCGFCTWWADFFAARSDLRIVGFSQLTPDLRGRLPEEYERCSHLVTDEAVYSCGASLEEALARSEIGDEVRPVVDFLRTFEDYEWLRERLYRAIADRRATWGQFLSADTWGAADGQTDRGDGDEDEPPDRD